MRRDKAQTAQCTRGCLEWNGGRAENPKARIGKRPLLSIQFTRIAYACWRKAKFGQFGRDDSSIDWIISIWTEYAKSSNMIDYATTRF